ncbi:MAG: hypothetical protein HYS83_02490 [Candidatus Blackburnbacteria bacterium]|nr:hypothetical protein [Candidatus Blackburnbacteria bacterium]
MTETMLPFSRQIMSPDKNQQWRRGEFLRPKPKETKRIKGNELILPEVKPEFYINQYGGFDEFEHAAVVETTGYNAQDMRRHGCGISVLHMVNSSIGSNEYRDKIKTVGELAQNILALHRNDLLDNYGNVVKRGTPVFNLRSGWYHDAMLYFSKIHAGLDVYRYEDLGSFDEVGQECDSIVQGGKEPLVIISVKNHFWRIEGEPESILTHQVILNGFRFNGKGEVTEFRATDPFSPNGVPKLNQWLKVDERIKQAFTGRVMFFVSAK